MRESGLESAGAMTIAATRCAIICSTRSICRLRSSSSLMPLASKSYSPSALADALCAVLHCQKEFCWPAIFMISATRGLVGVADVLSFAGLHPVASSIPSSRGS